MGADWPSLLETPIDIIYEDLDFADIENQVMTMQQAIKKKASE